MEIHDNPVTADAADLRRRVAGRIAWEVRHGHTIGEAKITKVTSLLHAFRVPGSPPKKNHVLEDLRAHGIDVHSGWSLDAGSPEIRRTGVLELSLTQTPTTQAVGPSGDETIQLSIWGPGTDPLEECPLPATYAKPPPDHVLWFNIDPPVLPPPTQPTPAIKAARSRQLARSVRGIASRLEAGPATPPAEPASDFLEDRVSHVKRQLRDWCPGLDEEMVRDLLRQDVQPKVETYGDERDGVRGVSVVAVIARETPGEEDDSDDVSEELLFQMVEIVVGDGWIVTCWHPSRIFIGTSEPEPGPPLLREPFRSHVHHRWVNEPNSKGSPGKPKSSGDLGIYLARSLVATYGASHRMMEKWVASWEVAFYQSLSAKNKAEKLKEAAREISNQLSMVGEFRRRLTALEHARWGTTDRSWFPSLTDRDDTITEEEDQSGQAKLLSAAIESAEKSFTLLADNIRADINLLMLQNTATQQESTERLQSYLGKVTGLVLVPTFVAGLFGANTQLPGGGRWLGFEFMIILMILSAVGVYFVMRRMAK